MTDKDEKKLKLEENKKARKKENAEQKKRVEAELEGSTDDEDDTVKVTRVGYIEVKMKKKEWKYMYCVLIGGSFYYYKESSDIEPRGSIDLVGVKVSTVQAKGKKRKFCYAIVKNETELFAASCSNEKELNEWVSAIGGNIGKEKSDPPVVVAEKSKKQGVMKRVEKRVTSKTATSTFGKKVMKAIVNEETTTLLSALKHIVKAQTGSSKVADELEKNIIKLSVKAFLLIENKSITADDFLAADKPLREAFELMVKIFNGRGRVKYDKITAAIQKVDEHLKKAEEIITNLLAPHLSSKNMFRISYTFGIITNENFLTKVFWNESIEEDLDKLIDAMEYYTQFHYH